MKDRLTYWKCHHCHGIGKISPRWSDHVDDCRSCDGTGNALVDGEDERARREAERRMSVGSTKPQLWTSIL